MPFSQGHALLIGVGTYQHAPALDVPISATDAEAVAAVLRDPAYCGYPTDQVTLLRNATATRDGILAGLDALAAQAGPDDTAVLYFCGHGDYGTDGVYYLTAHDTRIQSGKVASGTGVGQAELIAKLRAVKAKRLLVLINACFSGQLSPSLGPSHSEYAGAPLPDQTAAALLATGEGRIVIVACREEQRSYIGNGALSIFTQALVDGLRGKGTSSNRGYIGAYDLYTQVYFKVEATARDTLGKTQEPELTVLKGIGPFAVSLYRGATDLGAFDSGAEPPEVAAVRKVDPAYAQATLGQFRQHIGDSYSATLIGDGSIAQGPGARAAGAGGVIVGGNNSGTIDTGTRIDTGGGAYIRGNVSTGGDLVGRDRIEKPKDPS